LAFCLVVLPAVAVDENEVGGNNNDCSGSSVVTIRQFGDYNGVIEADDLDWWKIMPGSQGPVNIAFSCDSNVVQFYVSSGSSPCDTSKQELHWGVGAGNGDVTLEADRYYSIDINASGSGDPYDYTITITDKGSATLPVTLSSLTAKNYKGKVTLRWRTETEVSNIGFNIYRSDKKDGKFVKIGFVKGAGDSTTPNEYEYVDEKAKPEQVYYYIEDIDVKGIKTKSPVVKSRMIKNLVTTWGKIKIGMR